MIDSIKQVQPGLKGLWPEQPDKRRWDKRMKAPIKAILEGGPPLTQGLPENETQKMTYLSS